MHLPLRQLALLSLSTVAFAACTAEPGQTFTPRLQITASPVQIVPDGSTTTLSVSTKDATYDAGTGTVSLTTTNGRFGNDAKSITLTLSSAGEASTTWSCPAESEPACTGPQT